ncbi:alkaline phosphatase family protein [Anaerobacillus sp. MEB173]|uniref:alkaline phosphatase family protein n=1 Tax=Anaerobacillus sp. MEB173 TaxID=3383345 RepID=UPI003F8F12CA
MRRLLLIVMTFLLLISSGCNQNEGEFKGASIAEKKSNTNKKVIVVMLDTMMGSLIDSSREKGGIPALDFLIENGFYYKDLVSPFPSMSVVIESSLITGQTPDKHEIPGLVWYKTDENRLIDYGSTYEKLVKLGLTQSLEDSVYHLNNTHLSKNVTTIYEDLSRKNFTTGSINMLLYRGDNIHTINIPTIPDQALGLPEQMQTKGPDILAFGKMVKPKVLQDKDLPDSIFSRYGLNDAYAIETVKTLINEGEQPDLMMVFLPDFDKKAHHHSPYYRLGFEQAELFFQDILNSYESWDQALDENIFIVLGDHGSDKQIEDDEKLTIDLESIFHDYAINRLGDPIQEGELVFANNHRMTYVYPIGGQEVIPTLAETAMIDNRIAMAAWLEEEWIHVITPDTNKQFRFKQTGPWTDRYDQTWTIEGEYQNVTLKIDDKKKRISYVDYPDVLNQLYSSLHSLDTPALVLAAKPGHAFGTEGAPAHPDGGEHGGIHKNDTLTALIVAGTDVEPRYRRITDLKEYILGLFSKEINKAE